MAYWQSNEKTKAKNWYNKATEWMEYNRDQWFREFTGETFGLFLEATKLMGMEPKEF